MGSRTGPAPLEPSDSPEGLLDGDLGSVTDDEWWTALNGAPAVRYQDGSEANLKEGAVWAPGWTVEDLRAGGFLPPAAGGER